MLQIPVTHFLLTNKRYFRTVVRLTNSIYGLFCFVVYILFYSRRSNVDKFYQCYLELHPNSMCKKKNFKRWTMFLLVSSIGYVIGIILLVSLGLVVFLNLYFIKKNIDSSFIPADPKVFHNPFHTLWSALFIAELFMYTFFSFYF